MQLINFLTVYEVKDKVHGYGKIFFHNNFVLDLILIDILKPNYVKKEPCFSVRPPVKRNSIEKKYSKM